MQSPPPRSPRWDDERLHIWGARCFRCVVPGFEMLVSGLGGDIVGRLGHGDVLVVWMFDASLSMYADRMWASRQMGKIFQEIDQRLKGKVYRARHAVLSFGQGSNETSFLPVASIPVPRRRRSVVLAFELLVERQRLRIGGGDIKVVVAGVYVKQN